MSIIPNLSEATVRQHTAGGSFERGEHYYERGAVKQIDLHDGKLEAYVQGSQPLPYTVTVRYDEEGIHEATCSCPYHAGSWCKHVVAVLLVQLQGDRQEARLLPTLLDNMSRDELVSLVRRLAVRDPRVEEWIEEEQAA